jgi:membrane protein implicated in regulation of membrane protease activity
MLHQLCDIALMLSWIAIGAVLCLAICHFATGPLAWLGGIVTGGIVGGIVITIYIDMRTR